MPWKLECIIGNCRTNPWRGKNTKKHFQGYSLLLFDIAVMFLNYVFRKWGEGSKLTKSQDMIDHLMYTDNMKVFRKMEKNGDPDTNKWICSLYIAMEFGIEKSSILIMKSGKRQITEGIELPQQGKSRTFGKIEVFGELRSAHRKTCEDDGKISKEYLKRTGKHHETMFCRIKSQHRRKYLGR